jgi:hypothetical protein
MNITKIYCDVFMRVDNNFQIDKENIDLLEEELQCGKLYKIFMLSPLHEKYFRVDSPGNITFIEGFLDYFNDVMRGQTILFAEDDPRNHHHFSQNDRVMFVMLVPPNLVLCIDGNLLLKKNHIILESILGVYLFNDSDQFFTNSKFSSHHVKQWLVNINAQPSSTAYTSVS